MDWMSYSVWNRYLPLLKKSQKMTIIPSGMMSDSPYSRSTRIPPRYS